ncbi:MAG TPA: hypothetical protein VLG47_00805 [Candidatus Saccharimonadales bacterium]|nr:hypothetical protein [Candidatus Saccharimonadales bacterium]
MGIGELSSAASQGPRQYAEILVSQYAQILEQAVAIAAPDRAGESPLDVFPERTTPRDQAPTPEWDAGQEAELRGLIAEFGYGREGDRTISELGVQEAHVIIQAGQPHKIMAEVGVVLEDENTNPKSFIFCGNPSRKIVNVGEQQSAQKQLGFVPENEYVVARAIAVQMPGFRRNAAGDQVLAVSYDMEDGFAVSDNESGQFTLIGFVGDGIESKPVIMFRVDQAERHDESKGGMVPVRPEPADTMNIISDAESLFGDPDTPLAFVTSATYQASTEIEAVRASLTSNRVICLPTYGTAGWRQLKANRNQLQLR